MLGDANLGMMGYWNH